MMVRTADPMIIAIVPAKRKSSRLPNKNWRPYLNGESLAERKFLFSIGCGFFHHTVMSCDFPKSEIDFFTKEKNQYALHHSQGWTFRRRPRFMVDDSAQVALDALEYVGAKDTDYYCLLQPTSPLLTSSTLFKGLTAMKAHESQVVSVNPAYKPNGAFYAGKISHLRKYSDWYQPHIVPYVMDWLESMDVDEYYDFEIARCMYE